MAAGENCFAPELNEKVVIELLQDLSNIFGGGGGGSKKELFHSRLWDMR